jgi:hypothetical protein
MCAQRFVGKWCLGHGVIGQAASLRTGHYVEAQYVDAVFAHNTHGGKAFATDLMPRCNLCRSIRRWHDHGANALRRARKFRREHAERWVKLGRAESIEAALAEMDIGGVTDVAVAGLMVVAIGEPCPGMCAYEQDGRICRHSIARVSELHVDVRDPTQPLTLENLGILCISCNTAKGDTPWATFIYRRRAQLLAWQAAIDNPSFRQGEQQVIPGLTA